MDDLISVVVAAYNVEAYLPQCLDSILHQDHQNLEVLLVDDGSKDATGSICDAYGAKDSRVKVIHQKNGGAAAAKNAGLRAASGEYLCIVDSDDYLEPNVLGYMLETLKENEADAAVFSFRYVYRNRSEDYPMPAGRRVFTGTEYLLQFLTDWSCAICVNKIYRRSLFENIFLEEGHKIDDEYFTYQGLMNAGKVVCDDRIIYNYRQRASSAMQLPASRAQRIMDQVDAISKRRANVVRRFPGLRKAYDTAFLEAMIYTTEYPDNSEDSLNLLRSQVRQYFREKGNTFPPKYLWKGLLRLLLTDNETLLWKFGRKQEETSSDQFFA